jgi:tetratricopeptide (TPR) repeat protein
MKRIGDAIQSLNTIMNESESNRTNPDLFVLRARLFMENKEASLCYYDLKASLILNPQHLEAVNLMKKIEEDAEQLRNTCLVLSLNNRLTDAITKICGAIKLNPDKAEYHLQRGILHKRNRDFNAAIDDFLLGLDKINNDENNDPNLYSNLQRQILLTYNDFALHCFEKLFYDDAIVLLNRAIKIEKNEKGLYINRGG